MQQKTKRQYNTHRNELWDDNCHFPDLVQDILRKKGELNLVLGLAKPSVFMAVLNIPIKWQHYMTGLQYKQMQEHPGQRNKQINITIGKFLFSCLSILLIKLICFVFMPFCVSLLHIWLCLYWLRSLLTDVPLFLIFSCLFVLITHCCQYNGILYDCNTIEIFS